MKEINWTLPMLKRFKRAYKLAKMKAEDPFMFDGNEFVISYAKYLIEYLDSKFGGDK